MVLVIRWPAIRYSSGLHGIAELATAFRPHLAIRPAQHAIAESGCIEFEILTVTPSAYTICWLSVHSAEGAGECLTQHGNSSTNGQNRLAGPGKHDRRCHLQIVYLAALCLQESIQLAAAFH